MPDNETREKRHPDLIYDSHFAAEVAMVNADGPDAAEKKLLALVKSSPTRVEHRISLARLYRHLALRHTPEEVDRGKLFQAREQLLQAVSLQTPPEMATLNLLWLTTHDLAMHAEQAAFFTDVGRTDSRPEIRFKALCWAATALQCRGNEVAAEGDESGAMSCYEDAVLRHKEALEAWPDAPVKDKVDGADGHVRIAYDLAGKHREWLEHVTGLLSSTQGQALPPELRARHLFWASGVASRGHFFNEALELAQCAQSELSSAQTGHIATGMQTRFHILGALVEAHKGLGDTERKRAVVAQIEELLARAEKDSQHEEHLWTYYNIAAARLVGAEEWEPAIRTSRRAIELSDFGAHYVFLAIALWAGRKDRAGTLAALRGAAQDARISGKGQCRNLRDDFLRHPVFADVHDDPEFLDAIEVAGVVG